jgi:hypothetical protein
MMTINLQLVGGIVSGSAGSQRVEWQIGDIYAGMTFPSTRKAGS